MKKIITTSLLAIFSTNIYSQDIIYKMSDFNGIYETQDKYSYLIFKEGKYLDISFDFEENIYLSELSYYGFCADSIHFGENLKLKKSEIRTQSIKGYKLFVMGKPIKNKEGILDAMTYEFQLGDDKPELVLFYIKDLYYWKKEKLSLQREKLLRSECKKKNIDIDYFLGKEKQTYTIKSHKALIYTEPNKPTKMYLLKGDIVTVLQEKGNWFYIFYVTNKNKEIKGWVKKEDVK